MTPAFDIAALESPLREKAEFFLEPPDRGTASEYERQRAFVNHMRAYCRECFVFAIPNGSKDSDWTKLRKWGEGAVKGFPDIGITWNRGIFFAEFKDGKGKPSQAQIETLNRLHRLGHRVGVYRNADTLLAHLADAGAPVRLRR